MTDVYRTGKKQAPGKKARPFKSLKENLFNTWYNTLPTFLALGLLYLFANGVLRWVLVEANWNVIPVNLQLLMIGTFP